MNRVAETNRNNNKSIIFRFDSKNMIQNILRRVAERSNFNEII